jgi:haloalkane dehalogenase
MPFNFMRRWRRLLLATVLSGGCASNMASTDIVYTPAERFTGLPGYSFAEHHTEVAPGLRMHYVAEGPADGPTVVLLHGQPSWSYLYRKMIGPLASAGHRVLAPDLIGYGKSGKYTERSAYSYEAHVQWVSTWLAAQKLRDATLVVHDWGGLIGLRILAQHPELFARVVVLNTSFNVGVEYGQFSPRYREGLARWEQMLLNAPVLRFGEVVRAQTAKAPSEAELAAYDAPYPGDRYNQGPRVMTSLIPLRPGDVGVAENRRLEPLLKALKLPVFICVSEDIDRLHPGQHQRLRELFVGGQLWADLAVPGTRHFIQEDAGAQLAAWIADFAAGRRPPFLPGAAPAAARP